jgi:hypothetical protein
MIEGVPESEMHCVMPCNVWCIIGAKNAICTVQSVTPSHPVDGFPPKCPHDNGIHPWTMGSRWIHLVMAPENLPQPYLFPPVPVSSDPIPIHPSIPYLTLPIPSRSSRFPPLSFFHIPSLYSHRLTLSLGAAPFRRIDLRSRALPRTSLQHSDSRFLGTTDSLFIVSERVCVAYSS